jgi:basic membrane lipoprotein Med (substrate-binding protein (PBP1-ABC) superfamily)
MALIACSPTERRQSADAEDSERGDQVLRVALLTPGPISDQSWNAGAYAGLQQIHDSLGAVTSHIQTRTPAEFEENLRQYGVEGYDIVFGHGFEFQEPASRIGPEFPRTVYIVTSGNQVGSNVAPIVFGFEESSYLAGLIAGSLTRTGVIGTIGGTELPPVKSSFLAFTAGARAARPDVRVLSAYLGTWDDASAGREQALAQIGQGADIIFQNADAAGLGVFQAARQRPGVRAFGSNSDQNAVAPDVVIGSVVIDLPHAFLTVAREVQRGGFRPRVLAMGLREDVVKLVLNPRLAHLIPADLRARLDSAEQRMLDGSLRPPRLEFVDTAATR